MKSVNIYETLRFHGFHKLKCFIVFWISLKRPLDASLRVVFCLTSMVTSVRFVCFHLERVAFKVFAHPINVSVMFPGRRRINIQLISLLN